MLSFRIGVCLALLFCLSAAAAIAFDFNDCESEENWRATFKEWSANSFEIEFDGATVGLGFAVGRDQESLWIVLPGHVAFGHLLDDRSSLQAAVVREHLRVRLSSSQEEFELCTDEEDNPRPLIHPQEKDLTFLCVRRLKGHYPLRSVRARRVSQDDEYRVLGKSSQPKPEELSGRLALVSSDNHQSLELRAHPSAARFAEGLSGAMVITPAGLVGMYVGSDRHGRAIDLTTIRREADDVSVPWSLTDHDYYDCQGKQEVCFAVQKAPRPDALITEMRDQSFTIPLLDGRSCTTLPEGVHIVRPATSRHRCEPMSVRVLDSSAVPTHSFNCRLSFVGRWSAGRFGDLLCSDGGFGVAHCTGLAGIGRGLFSGRLTSRQDEVALRGSFQSAYVVSVEGSLVWTGQRLEGSIQLQEPGSNPVNLILEDMN